MARVYFLILPEYRSLVAMAAVLLCYAPTVTALEWTGTTSLAPICVKFTASKPRTELACGSEFLRY